MANKIMKKNLIKALEKHAESAIAISQGHIFEYASDQGYDLREFVHRYMESDFCNQEMDSYYSSFHDEFARPCMEVILKEFSDKGICISKDKDHHFRYCAYPIGFIYRYLQLLSGYPSKELIHRIPFDKMINDYYVDHWDYADNIKFICQKENIII